MGPRRWDKDRPAARVALEAIRRRIEGRLLRSGLTVAVVGLESKEEAIEWAKRVPFTEGQVELRQVFELEDFGSGEAVVAGLNRPRWHPRS